jgi:hypothetical protein
MHCVHKRCQTNRLILLCSVQYSFERGTRGGLIWTRFCFQLFDALLLTLTEDDGRTRRRLARWQRSSGM